MTQGLIDNKKMMVHKKNLSEIVVADSRLPRLSDLQSRAWGFLAALPSLHQGRPNGGSEMIELSHT